MKQLGAAHELRAFVAKLRRRGEGTRRRPSGGWGDSPRSVQSAQSTASSGDSFIVSDSASLTQDPSQSCVSVGFSVEEGSAGGDEEHVMPCFEGLNGGRRGERGEEGSRTVGSAEDREWKGGGGGRLRRSGGACLTNRALDVGERMGSKGYSSNSAGDGPGGDSEDASVVCGGSEGSNGSENDDGRSEGSSSNYSYGDGRRGDDEDMEDPVWRAGDENKRCYQIWERRADMHHSASFYQLGLGVGGDKQYFRNHYGPEQLHEQEYSPGYDYDPDIVRPAFWSTTDQNGHAMAWDRMRRTAWWADHPSGAVSRGLAMLLNESPGARGWANIEVALYPSLPGELLGRFFHHPMTFGLSRGTQAERVMERRLLGLKHFEDHRARAHVMESFLPGVQHFEEVDTLASALAADIEAIARRHGASTAKCRQQYLPKDDGDRDDGGALWGVFRLSAYTRGAEGAWRTAGGPQRVEILMQGLARSDNLPRYVKSLVFFGADEMDCLCHALGHEIGYAFEMAGSNDPVNYQEAEQHVPDNVLLLAREFIQDRFLCRQLAEWLWAGVRLLLSADMGSLPALLPPELKTKIAKGYLEEVVPRSEWARGKESRPWTKLLDLPREELCTSALEHHWCCLWREETERHLGPAYMQGGKSHVSVEIREKARAGALARARRYVLVRTPVDDSGLGGFTC